MVVGSEERYNGPIQWAVVTFLLFFLNWPNDKSIFQ